MNRDMVEKSRVDFGSVLRSWRRTGGILFGVINDSCEGARH